MFRMLPTRSFYRIAVRGVRQRRNDIVGKGGEGKERRDDPVEWIKDATTYEDVKSVILDPTTKLPYSNQDMENLVKKTARDALKEKNRLLYGNKKSSSELSFDHIPLEKQIILLFPGQGQQIVGMGKKLENSKKAMELYKEASEILKYDLYNLCTKGPKNNILLRLDQTLFTQPAVLVTSLAALESFKEEEPEAVENFTDTAGFSVGEVTSIIAAGIISFKDGVSLIAERARVMHEASQSIRASMVTIRVNAASRLEDALRIAKEEAIERGEIPLCEVANHLYCGVKVIGASEDSIQFLENNAERFKFQIVKRLAVSGAFHTSQMIPAMQPYLQFIKTLELQAPSMNVYSNFTGQVFGTKKAAIRGALVKQLSSPIKWEQIIQLLYRKHRDYVFPRFIEMGPGRSLGTMLYQTSKKAFKSYKNIPMNDFIDSLYS